MDLQHLILVDSQPLRPRRRPVRVSIFASMTLTPLGTEGSVRKNRTRVMARARVAGKSGTWEPSRSQNRLNGGKWWVARKGQNTQRYDKRDRWDMGHTCVILGEYTVEAIPPS